MPADLCTTKCIKRKIFRWKKTISDKSTNAGRNEKH